VNVEKAANRPEIMAWAPKQATAKGRIRPPSRYSGRKVSSITLRGAITAHPPSTKKTAAIPHWIRRTVAAAC
jgi:hypothetical protein